MKIYVGKRDARGFFPVTFSVRRDGQTTLDKWKVDRGTLTSAEFMRQGVGAVLEKANADMMQRLAQVNAGEEK